MNRRKEGTLHEREVELFLEKQGYHFLCRNYRCPLGEIDLIGVENGYLVFLEVKFRSTTRNGSPEGAVSFAKQRRLSKAAAWYMMEHGLSMDISCRFDVAAVEGKEIRILQDAFPYRD